MQTLHDDGGRGPRRDGFSSAGCSRACIRVGSVALTSLHHGWVEGGGLAQDSYTVEDSRKGREGSEWGRIQLGRVYFFSFRANRACGR